MTAAPLWLIQNVRLADRDGLWQIAIDKGRFGEITPMGEAHDESYEVLNARGGLAIRFYRAAYPSGYHPDGRRAELESVRYSVRGD